MRSRLLLPLFGSVALLFLVASVNVAGLFVARGLQRHREYAMRAALGASRVRLFRQVLTESAAIAMLGAVGGAAVAAGGIRLFKAIGGQAVPRAESVTVGWPIFAFGLGAALLAALRGRAPARAPCFVGPPRGVLERLAHQRRARRAPAARDDRDRPGRVHRGAAGRRDAADPHRQQARERAARATRPSACSR